MKKISLYLAVLVFLSFFLFGCDFWPGASSQEKEAAVDAAIKWLELIDGKHYLLSWEKSSKFLKKTFPRDQWQQYLLATRVPIGSITSRKFRYTDFDTAMRGSGEGKYFLIFIDIMTSKKGPMIERVTMAQDERGRWKACGYNIMTEEDLE